MRSKAGVACTMGIFLDMGGRKMMILRDAMGQCRKLVDWRLPRHRREKNMACSILVHGQRIYLIRVFLDDGRKMFFWRLLLGGNLTIQLLDFLGGIVYPYY